MSGFFVPWCHACQSKHFGPCGPTKPPGPSWNCPIPGCDGRLLGERTRCPACQDEILRMRYGKPPRHHVAEVVEKDIVADLEQATKVARFREELDEMCRSLDDDDDKQSFPTGAVRDRDDGKTNWSLLPWRELERVVRETYMPGAEHYGDHNWTKGIPSSRCLKSLQRHVLAFSMGDTSEDHLGRAVFNCLAILHNERVF